MLANVLQTCRDHLWALGEAIRVYWAALRYIRSRREDDNALKVAAGWQKKDIP